MTRPYPCFASSEESALEGLRCMLELGREEHGDCLVWVTLERSMSAEEYYDYTDWTELERLTA